MQQSKNCSKFSTVKDTRAEYKKLKLATSMQLDYLAELKTFKYCHAPLPPASAVDVRSFREHARDEEREEEPSSFTEFRFKKKNAMSLSSIQRTLNTPLLAYGPHVILYVLHSW